VIWNCTRFCSFLHSISKCRLWYCWQAASSFVLMEVIKFACTLVSLKVKVEGHCFGFHNGQRHDYNCWMWSADPVNMTYERILLANGIKMPNKNCRMVDEHTVGGLCVGTCPVCHWQVVKCVQGWRRSCQTKAMKVNCRFCRVPIKRATLATALSAKLGLFYSDSLVCDCKLSHILKTS